MSATAPALESSRPLKPTYVCAGVTVLNLPKRALLKSLGKYFIRIHIGGKEQWTSREIRTKESKVVWDADEDRHHFECDPTADLRVTLFKNHSGSRPPEEVGALARRLTDWTQAEMVGQLVTNSKNNLSIVIQLALTRKEPDSRDLNAALQEPAETLEATANVAVLSTEIPGLTAATRAVGNIENLTESAADIGEALGGLLDKLHVFVGLIDTVSEVHPYVKMAWTILSAAFKAARAQQERDKKMMALIERMTTAYDFLCDAEQLRDDKARMGVLSRLALQTVDCAYFISSCIRNTSFVTRLASQSLSNVGNKIDEYSKSFDALLREFQYGSQLRTEMVTVHILEDIKNLNTEIQIERIPYAPGAGYEPGRRCLKDTRKALLEQIGEWAISTEADTPNLLVLMGPAGTGKSTIAHTVALRFNMLKRLGASFCFSSSLSASRKAANLFRNIARDLANFDPAFKAALCSSLAVDLDHLCTTEDLELQFEKLILEPAQALAVNGTILIMVDALDESGNERERRTLLRLLFTRLQQLPTGFRVLFTCRPEEDIRERLDRIANPATVIQMPRLEDDKTLSSDILTYIQHTLRDDRDTFPPGIDETSCVVLAHRAQGLFQWAFVACDYIHRRIFGKTMVDRYNDVLNGTDQRAGLDGLYKTVLDQLVSENPDALHAFKAVMGFLLGAVEPLSMASLREMSAVLPERLKTEPERILPSLGSLLSGVGDSMTLVRPLHASFGEMLQSVDRAGPYYIGQSGYDERLLTASLRLLRDGLHFNMGDQQNSYGLFRDSDPARQASVQMGRGLLYACKYWGHHLSKYPAEGGTMEEELHELVRVLLLNNLLFWLEASSLSGSVANVIPCLLAAMDRLKAMDDTMAKMAQDCTRFIRAFARPIIDSPAHIYISALVWLPSETIISRHYGSAYPHIARISTGRDRRWSVMNMIMSGHGGGVHSVAFCPEGLRIVSSSHDRTIRFWDAYTGEAIGKPLIGHSRSVDSVAFASDGRRIVSGSSDRTLRLWDADTREVIGEPLSGHSDCVNSVAFSPDCTRIVSGSLDRTLRLWDVTTGEAIGQPLLGHNSRVTSVTFSPDGLRIASGSWDCTVRLWDSATGEPSKEPLIDCGSWVWSVAFSPDGRRIVSGLEDGSLRLWDADSAEAIGEPLTGHLGSVEFVAFSPDGHRIVSGSNDRTIRQWDAETGVAVGTPLSGHIDSVNSVVFSPDSQRIVSGSSDNTLRLWDADAVEVIREPFTGHIGGVYSVAFSPNGRCIVSGSEDNTLRLWDTATGEALGEPLSGHCDSVTSVAFSSDGHHIVSGSDDQTIRLWDANTGTAIGEPMTASSSDVTCVGFSPDNQRIISGSRDGTIRLWDVHTAKSIGEPLSLAGHRTGAECVAFSPDGRRIIAGFHDYTLRLWDAASGEPIGGLLRSHSNSVMCVAFSPDGRRVVSGSDDTSLRLWNADTGEAIGDALRGHDALVSSVAFSPDSRHIVSSSWDNTVRVWNADTGEAIGEPLTGHAASVNSVAWSNDGRHIVSGAYDHTIRVWDADAVITTRTTHPNAHTSASPSSALDDRHEGINTTTASTPLARREKALTLSPSPQHQLTQSYPCNAAGECRISFNFETGWIMGNDTDYVLWVPPDKLRRLYGVHGLEMVIPGPTIDVDLSDFVHGTRWAECRRPLDREVE
ncbi:WD40 repeat-like protein [Calocera cornea HHB12733]|uniref:WD40 repeat-like protein n=1 Tax=Calocera cornea HHB12733 TaxID=1353952 RepID=A0A165CPG0_9BASI|nr:WD40 repeat-like protein [Calocera cornea HHB12733]